MLLFPHWCFRGFRVMAFIGSQTEGITAQHEEIISVIGNISTVPDSLSLTIDNVNITNIDVLELRYRPDVSEVTPTDLDILEIAWRNTNLKNNSGEHYISVYPTREADGTYHYEPNHPPNLFYQEDSLHSHLRKKYSLSIRKKNSGLPLNTQNILLRLKVTKFRSSAVIFNGKFETAILNQ